LIFLSSLGIFKAIWCIFSSFGIYISNFSILYPEKSGKPAGNPWPHFFTFSFSTEKRIGSWHGRYNGMGSQHFKVDGNSLLKRFLRYSMTTLGQVKKYFLALQSDQKCLPE
jgi:hypothetical protein